MENESFVDKWNAGKKIFAAILIINIFAILASVLLPVGFDTLEINESVFCSQIYIGSINSTENNMSGDLCLNSYHKSSIFIALGIIIVVNMIGFLAFFNRMSTSPDLTKGEMRKTFAITIIMIYLLVVALTITDYIDWNENSELFQNFTYVVITVVIFYFGSRAWTQARGNGQNNLNQNIESSSKISKETGNAEAKVAEMNLALKKAENKTKEAELKRNEATSETERISAEEEVKESKENESSAKKNLDEAIKRAESENNESRNPADRIAIAKIELKLEEMNEKLLSEQKSNISSTIPSPIALSATNSDSSEIQTLMDTVVAEFEQFVAQNPGTSADTVNTFQQKFTSSVNGLISQRNSANNAALDSLDRSSPDFAAKKQELLEQKSHIADNLAIKTEDLERLHSRLNEIHKQSATNLNLKKVVNGIDLTGKSPREISRLISDGDIPPMIIGPKSFLILKQELVSMSQSRKFSEMTSTEQENFRNLLEQRIQETLTLPDENQRNELLDIIEKIQNNNS